MNLFGDDDVIFDDDENIEEDLIEPTVQLTDSLVEPQSMSFCLGHEEQEGLFLDLFKKKTMPHALIFSGPKGVGKSTMAYRLARFLFKYGKEEQGGGSLFGEEEDLGQNFSSLDVDEHDPIFTRVSSGGYPDFLSVRREYDAAKGKYDSNLKVEAIRKIAPFLRKTSSDGGWRIVIVDDADRMNRNAQNAILKILEEPPANVLIILIAHRPGMLIPTIHSRSRVIAFKSLSFDVMSELLDRRGYAFSATDYEKLHVLSEGSFGQAVKYADEDGLEMLSRIMAQLNYYPDWDMSGLHKVSQSLSSPSQDKEYVMFCRILQWIVGRILFSKVREDQSFVKFAGQGSEISKISGLSLERLIRINDNLKKHFERVEFSNLDRRDAVRDAFLVISE